MKNRAEGRDETLSGWGNTPKRRCRLETGEDAQLEGILRVGETRALCLRGMGRSYGDSAVLGGGLVYQLNPRGDTKMVFNLETRTVSVDAGVRLADLVAAAGEHGLVVPVVPGTANVSIGGMIAADIHGKNHHKAGSFANFVNRIEILDGAGNRRILHRGEENFDATTGGMGLNGAITRAEVSLEAVPGPYITQRGVRAENFHGVCETMLKTEEATFTVAWLDLSNRRARGTVLYGNWAEGGGWSKKSRGGVRKIVPTLPVSMVHPGSVRAFNELWWAKGRFDEREKIVPMRAFFHPLDGVEQWNRLYGPKGFIQYQFVVPPGRIDVLEAVVEDLVRRKVGTPMVVLKRFKESEGGHLSFPIEGWTLAVDISAGVDQLPRILWGYDDMVAEAGGRVYLAKDACLQRDHVETMYPKISRWRQLCLETDPMGVFQSDQSRRLGLR